MDAHKSAAIRLADAERCRGGQAAIEFISYLSFFLVLFAVSVILFIDQQRADVIEKRTMLADEVASRFAE
ncbi:hypothetical protein FJZ26_06365, partial [Candidatus Parvarchaeota archaeon]|nr:hypothetical protein [Candidatus Parvarchaeota archaeon]